MLAQSKTLGAALWLQNSEIRVEDRLAASAPLLSECSVESDYRELMRLNP